MFVSNRGRLNLDREIESVLSFGRSAQARRDNLRRKIHPNGGNWRVLEPRRDPARRAELQWRGLPSFFSERYLKQRSTVSACYARRSPRLEFRRDIRSDKYWKAGIRGRPKVVGASGLWGGFEFYRYVFVCCRLVCGEDGPANDGGNTERHNRHDKRRAVSERICK